MNGETVLHRPPERVPWLQILVLTAGAFMAFLDTSIVNVAMPKLMATFGVGIDSIQWVSTAYMLSAGVTIPIVGFFSDRLGIKNTFLGAVGIFTAGSALCSIAMTRDFLIGARVIQAVGGGAIMPISTAYVYQIVRRDRIGAALGTRSIAVAAAPAFGPALGGYLIDQFNWHMIFTINLPIGVLTILLGMLLLPRIASQAKTRLDLLGMALVTTGAFFVLLGLSDGQSAGWHSLRIVTELTGGVFALIVFVLWELTTDHPVLDLRVFKGNSVLAASFIGIFLVMMAMFGAIFLLPIFVQQILGFTPLQTGILMMPAALVMGVVAPITGRLFDRFGAIPLCIIGIIIAAATTFQLSHLSVHTSYHTIEIWYMERSAGFALFMLPLTASGLNTVARRIMNRVTSLQSLVRQIAGALGIALVTYIYNRQSLVYGALYSDKVSRSAPGVSAFLHAHTGTHLLAVYALKLDVVNHATAAAIDYAMVLAAFVVLAILPLVFFLRRPKNAPAAGTTQQPAAEGPGTRPVSPVPATR